MGSLLLAHGLWSAQRQGSPSAHRAIMAGTFLTITATTD
jgi:hypothetical protein